MMYYNGSRIFLKCRLSEMVELDAGLSAQMAVTQQSFALGAVKNAARAEQKIADVLAQTVTASNNGKNVDVYA